MGQPEGSCEHCRETFRYLLVHNGFNDSAYAYCNTCSFTVELSGWHSTPKGLQLKIHQRISTEVEPFLKPCPCGGRFSASADPKCPHCKRPLSPIEAAAYIERNAAGTAHGWRWDRSWSGVYSIELDGKVVRDWWDQGMPSGDGIE